MRLLQVVRCVLVTALVPMGSLAPASAFAQSTQAAPSAAAPSAAAYVGKPIVEVRLLTEGTQTNEPVFLNLVETRVGQPLSMSAVRESITHLFSLGRFQDVQVDASEAPGGVRLRYDLIPLHSVQRVDFRGTPGLPEGLLRRTVADRFGATPPVGRADEVARTLEGLYRDRGYLTPTVRAVAVVEHDPERTLLTFEIAAGPRARIGGVRIDGDPREPRASFLRGIHAEPGAAYDPTAIREGLADFIKRMGQRARYEATASFHATPSPDSTVVELGVDVEPGPAVTVTFQGDPLPKNKIDELVPVKREGSVDEDLIEDSVRRIVSYLQQEGYWKASVTPERQERDGTLTIVFAVRRGLQYRIAEGTEVIGNRALPFEQLRPALAKLQAGDVFVESNLGTAVSAIAGMYQRLGFASVNVSGSENELAPAATVKPSITIVEGPLTVIGAVTFEGHKSLSDMQLRAVVSSAEGAPYYEPRVIADREAVLLEYLNAGYSAATVVVTPVASADGTRATLAFRITEGPQTIVDHIVIIGNTRTDEQVVKRELLLSEGKPLGLEDLLESQRRLAALGLFRRIRITPVAHGGTARQDVLVTVEESAATTLSYGGGLEVGKRLRATGPSGGAEERFEFAPRGFFDIGRRNIGGKNRSVNFYSRLSLRPDVAPLDDPTRDVSGFGFSEYRIVGTYREPRALGVNADLTLTAAVEQGVRSSFNFARKGVNVEMARRLSPGVRTSLRYSFGTTRTFDEQLTEQEQAAIDRFLPQVRLSGFAGGISRDTRDDVLDPGRGTFLSAEGSVAARALGGQVGFLKSYLQGYWFHRLPGAPRVIFASRAALGLANGFERQVPASETTPDVTVTVDDLPASERFFAGGGTTIRGFALDAVGAPNTVSPTGFPKGGNAVLIMNGELRVPLFGDLGAAIFVDGGNVFNRVNEFDVGALRGSAGFGIRYRSPIGPIRFDVGFKMDRREIAGRLEPRRAFHFSIGQAF